MFQTILTSPTEKRQKHDSLSVDKLSLPNMDTTLHILEWLLSKQKGLSEYNGYPVQCDGESQTCNIESQSQTIQTTTECSEKSIQTENLVLLKQQIVQSIKNTKDNCSQTVKTPESMINGILLSKNTVQVDDKCCQTDFSTEAELVVRRGRPTKKKRGTKGMKTKQAGIEEVIDNIFHEPLSKNHIDMGCQTDMSVDPTIDDSIASNYFLGRDFKSPTSDVKMDFKEEKLSPYDHLMISTPPLSDEMKSSSNCSNLLQIQEGKSDPVFTCSWCDKAMYNKRELRAHKKTHMYCSICKKKFRSIKQTHQHIQGCKVSKLNKSKDCNFNAYVRLIKIEKDAEVINKFPHVFEENR